MKSSVHFLISILFLTPWMAYSATCTSEGYTVATVNGVFTDEKGAIKNMAALKEKLGVDYGDQKINYEYLLNPTHLGGLGDVATAIKQKAFEDEAVGGYDLTEMVRAASEKVKTQKLLLVAHSQGNFYANSFYDVVVGDGWGVDPKSVAIYSVANPASRVAGDGQWITSDTDKVIAWVVASVPFKNIMAPNTHIVLQKGDDFAGHGFSEAYLKYKSTEIVKGIKSSLDELIADPERSEDVQCITTPKLTLAHKTSAVVFAVADPVVEASITTAVVAGKIAIFPTVIFAKGIYFVVSATVNAGIYIAKNVVDISVIAVSEARDAVASLLAGGPSMANSNSASIVGAFQNSPLAPQQPQPPQATPENLALTSGPALTTAPVLHPTVTPDSSDQPQSSQEQQSAAGVEAGVSSYSMSFGGGFAPEVVAVTDEEEATESSTATSDNPAVVSDGIVFATTSAPVYAVNPVVFSGEYYNSSSTFDTINLEIKNTSLENATTSVAFSAQVATTGVALLFTKEVEMTDSGVFQYRARLENSETASSTPWSIPDFFTANLATTTASSTRAVATTTRALVFETPNPANVLYSDLNQNGIADREEENVVASSSAWLAAGEYVFNNLTITNKAIITAAGNENSSSTFKGVKIFAKNLTVETGATISAEKQGYSTGPGYVPYKSGVVNDPAASHGGSGGGGPSSIYGSAIRPVDLGSAKGSRGGGAMQFVVTGTFKNNGTITANAGSQRASGGSILVVASVVEGSGTFTTKGGDTSWPNWSAGAGGRIAVHYEQSLFVGTAEAPGGKMCFYGCAQAGGSGTVAFIDATNNDLYLKSSFSFQKSDEPFSFHNIYISNGAWVGVDEGVTLTAENIFVDSAAHFSVANNAILKSQSILASGSSFITLGSGIALDVPVVTIGHKSNLSLLSEDTLVANSLIFKDGGTLTSGVKKAVFIDVSNLDVATSSAISAWVSTAESGMDEFFSSGAGASVYIKSSGKLIIDGSISANAPEGKVGGGIYIDTSNLVGMGTIVSQGGSMFWGGYYVGYKGPFAGGNVAVYYATSSFAGTAIAPGACGSYDGWSKTCAGNGKVVVDNIGNKPAIPLPPAPVILSSEKFITAFDLLIASSTISGVIDETAHTIRVVVPSGTDLLTLVPAITVSPLATSSPASGAPQDFTTPVEYVVTAEDGTTQVYIVTVTAESTPIPPVVASSEHAIVALDILVASSTISGVVDEMAHTISLTVPFGTDVLALSPRIVVSALATSSPASLEAQDFTNPVMYTVTAEDSSTQVYVVSVVVEAPPAALFPIISSYTFNGIAGNITADFATTTPTIELSLAANKDVDWVSITIENQADATKYKRYYSGAGCADDTAVCVKTWDGVLSSGEVAPNGEYRTKAHIKDIDGNDFNDYLLPYTIMTNREEI